MWRPALATAIIGLGSAFSGCSPLIGNGVHPTETSPACESRKLEPRGCPEREVLLINLEGATRWQITDGLAADRFVAVAYENCHLVLVPECTWEPGEPPSAGSVNTAQPTGSGGSAPEANEPPPPPGTMDFQLTSSDMVLERELPPGALHEWFSQGNDAIDHYGWCASLELQLQEEQRATAGRFPRLANELVGCDAATHYISAYMMGSYGYTLVDPHPEVTDASGDGDIADADAAGDAQGDEAPAAPPPTVLDRDEADSTVLGVSLSPLPTESVMVEVVTCLPGELPSSGQCVVAPLPVPEGVSKRARKAIAAVERGKASDTERLMLADEYLDMSLPEGALSTVHPLVYGSADVAVPEDVRLQALLVQLESLMRLGRSAEFLQVASEIRSTYPGSEAEGQANLAVGRYFCEEGEFDTGKQLFEEVELAFPRGELGAKARQARDRCQPPPTQTNGPPTKGG